MLVNRKTRQAAQRYHVLRSEVQNMPLGLAGAMLSSLSEMPIVTGQYTDSRGGACPLLAAWQSSKRTVALKHTFPQSWDVFCGLKNAKQARKCTPHEVGILRMLLEERLFPLGERVISTNPQELPSQQEYTPTEFTIVARKPEPAEQQDDSAAAQEEWSCDWQAELAQLSHSTDDSSAVVTVSRPTTKSASFVRSRRVAQAPAQDVYSAEWADNLSNLLSL